MNAYCLTLAAFFTIYTLGAQNTDTSFTTYQQNIKGTALSFKMVPVKGGTFVMGSDVQDKMAEPDEKPQHTISISPYWMGAYEVTYDEYDAFMQDEAITQNSKLDAVTRPSQPYIDMTLGMGKTGGFPANSMQQYGALMYCRWLYQKTGIFFRLPTEAEWEYACRAGATSTYFFGNDVKALNKYAWYKDNSGDKYHKVGGLQPNAWGLYDMLGNVAEWTMDQYDEAYFKKLPEAAADPIIAPVSRNIRTVRGGSFRDEAQKVRSADRAATDPVWNRRDPQIPKSWWWNADAPFVGFRVVRPVKQPTSEEIESFYKTFLQQ